MKLTDLFKSKQQDTIVQAPQNKFENRRTGETYNQWGTRICGIVQGSLNALPPYLHSVYNAIYNEQAQNVALQQAARANTQAEIDRTNLEISNIRGSINTSRSTIENTEKRIQELKEEQQEIRNRKETVNKEQKLKLTIGLCIIVPLTLYLFIFYSSTFYSAFFRNPTDMTDAMNAMFDSQALANAYAAGIYQLAFVLSAPIIFLGLGFCLHFFSIQEGKAKYLKMLGILLVTVMFDCILAYKIGDQLHAFGIETGLFPMEEVYTVNMAVHDINTWAVIFCGFIVYVIWGIVFDMCMSAYNKLDLNKTQLEGLKNQINTLQQQIQTEKTNIQNLEQQESSAKNQVQSLTAKLGHQVYIDYAAIRTEMNNFFAGWIKMMQVLSINQTQQEAANAAYKSVMSTLIPSN